MHDALPIDAAQRGANRGARLDGRRNDEGGDVMLMAARKLQGIGLVLLVLVFAMMLYPVSLKVAATRSELAQINHQIHRARENIRYLESELAVRASMRQLEQWNAESFGYSDPTDRTRTRMNSR